MKASRAIKIARSTVNVPAVPAVTVASSSISAAVPAAVPAASSSTAVPAVTAASSFISAAVPAAVPAASSSTAVPAVTAASSSISAAVPAAASSSTAVPAINKEPLLIHIAKILVGKHKKLDRILDFVREFVWVMDFLNRCDWETDPRNVYTFQQHVDLMGDILIEVWGDAAITNYFHDLISGHVLEMTLLFGPMYRLTQEAAERSNSENVKWELGHSQKGGNCNRKDGTNAERGLSTAQHHGRQILRKAGKADQILDDEARKEAERRAERRDARRAATPPRYPRRRRTAATMTTRRKRRRRAFAATLTTRRKRRKRARATTLRTRRARARATTLRTRRTMPTCRRTETRPTPNRKMMKKTECEADTARVALESRKTDFP
jgi:hypothetical protein